MPNRNINILINARDNASKKFAVVAGALATAFSARAVKDYISTQIDLADEIGKVSKRIGITAEAYQKLTFAARRSGATNQNLENSFRRMQSTIYDAEQGIKESTDALHALGISFEDLKGLSPERQFGIIADRLNTIQDSTRKAALAQDVFGRSGTALIPMLGTYKELGNELERMGGVMENDAVAAAEKFKDQMEDLSSTIKAGVVNSGLIEWLTDVVDRMGYIKQAIGANTLQYNVVRDPETGKNVAVVPNKGGTTTDAATKDELAKKKKEVEARRAAIEAQRLAARKAEDEKAMREAEKRHAQDIANTFGQVTSAKLPAGAGQDGQQAEVRAWSSRFLSGQTTQLQDPMEKTKENTQKMVDAQKQTIDRIERLPDALVNAMRARAGIVIAETGL